MNMKSETVLQSRPYNALIKTMMQSAKKRMNSENYDLLCNYQMELRNAAIATSTCYNQLHKIIMMTEMIDKSWKDITRDDINKLIFMIMEKYSADGKETSHTTSFKTILKPFVRLLKTGIRTSTQCKTEGIVDPPEIRGIIIRKVKCKVTKGDLLTHTEFTSMLSKCNGDLRNRAILWIFYEAGPRASEAVTRQLKHVSQDSNGIILSVDGKTGARPIRLVASAPAVTQWLNVHPLRDNLESALLVHTVSKSFGQPLQYGGAYKVVKKAARLAGIKRSIYPHLFRHTATTNSLSFMNEQQQKLHFGWDPESKMPSRYSHLNSDDVDDAILKHHGIKKIDTKENTNSPKICQICKTSNDAQNKMCNKCSRPLDLKAAMDIDEQKSKEIMEIKDQVAKQDLTIAKSAIIAKENNILLKQLLAEKSRLIPQS